MNKRISKNNLVTILIVGSAAALIYLMLRSKGAEAAPPSRGGESIAEKQAMTTLAATRAINTVLQQAFESVRTLPPVSLTSIDRARLESARLDLERANAQTTSFINQSDTLVSQLVDLKNQMDEASDEEYDGLLLQYQLLRTQQINVVNQYQLARADALRAATLYSQIRAGLA